MSLERLTKAELIKQIEEMKAKEEERAKEIEFDFAFKETDEEKLTHDEKQKRKDFIKRMTKGRYVSEEKYQEFMDQQQQRMRR